MFLCRSEDVMVSH